MDKLPFLAACAGMTHLAVSDHDSIQSVRYAYAHPVQNGVHLIPATELTAYDYERAHRVHLLCYWPDDCAPLADFAAMMAERRLTAMLQSCKELEQICPQFRTEEALELARDSGTLFKAQVMRVLWQYGLADGMYNTVYKSLFGLKPVRGRILHTPWYEPVDTVLEVIKASRAVVVLAHPSVYHSMELARELDRSRAAGRRRDQPPPQHAGGQGRACPPGKRKRIDRYRRHGLPRHQHRDPAPGGGILHQ